MLDIWNTVRKSVVGRVAAASLASASLAGCDTISSFPVSDFAPVAVGGCVPATNAAGQQLYDGYDRPMVNCYNGYGYGWNSGWGRGGDHRHDGNRGGQHFAPPRPAGGGRPSGGHHAHHS